MKEKSKLKRGPPHAKIPTQLLKWTQLKKWRNKLHAANDSAIKKTSRGEREKAMYCAVVCM